MITRRALVGSGLAGGVAAPWLKLGAAPLGTGVTDTEIVLGTSAAFSGPSRGLGIELYRGANACFQEVNAGGGVNGRNVVLRIEDDGYQPDPCVANTMKLMLEDQVFLLFGYVGTPTVTRVLPLLKKFQDRSMFLFFPFTGAQPQRQPPYGDFAFNLRASYAQETGGLVDNFVKVGRSRIAVFYQADAYGRSGWAGVRAALKRHGKTIVGEATYKRGSKFTSVMRRPVEILKQADPQAVICIGAYAACAAFARDAVDNGLRVPIANLSFVGSENMLKLLTEGRPPRGKRQLHALAGQLASGAQLRGHHHSRGARIPRDDGQTQSGAAGGTRDGGVHALQAQFRESGGLFGRQAARGGVAPSWHRADARGVGAGGVHGAGSRSRFGRAGLVRAEPATRAANRVLHRGGRGSVRHVGGLARTVWAGRAECERRGLRAARRARLSC